MKHLLLALLLLCGCHREAPKPQADVYVDANVKVSGDGSEKHPFKTLQEAFDSPRLDAVTNRNRRVDIRGLHEMQGPRLPEWMLTNWGVPASTNTMMVLIADFGTNKVTLKKDWTSEDFARGGPMTLINRIAYESSNGFGFTSWTGEQPTNISPLRVSYADVRHLVGPWQCKSSGDPTLSKDEHEYLWNFGRWLDYDVDMQERNYERKRLIWKSVTAVLAILAGGFIIAAIYAAFKDRSEREP